MHFIPIPCKILTNRCTFVILIRSDTMTPIMVDNL